MQYKFDYAANYKDWLAQSSYEKFQSYQNWVLVNSKIAISQECR